MWFKCDSQSKNKVLGSIYQRLELRHSLPEKGSPFISNWNPEETYSRSSSRRSALLPWKTNLKKADATWLSNDDNHGSWIISSQWKYFLALPVYLITTTTKCKLLSFSYGKNCLVYSKKKSSIEYVTKNLLVAAIRHVASTSRCRPGPSVRGMTSCAARGAHILARFFLYSSRITLQIKQNLIVPCMSCIRQEFPSRRASEVLS